MYLINTSLHQNHTRNHKRRQYLKSIRGVVIEYSLGGAINLLIQTVCNKLPSSYTMDYVKRRPFICKLMVGVRVPSYSNEDMTPIPSFIFITYFAYTIISFISSKQPQYGVQVKRNLNNMLLLLYNLLYLKLYIFLILRVLPLYLLFIE